MTLQLVTIPVSHYCEKARWALDRAGIGYQEKGHLPVLHYLASLRLGSRTVPILDGPEGRWCESAEIVAWVDRQLDPEQRLVPVGVPLAQDWQRRLDLGYGDDTRRWAYRFFLSQPRLLRKYGVLGVPGWQRRLLPLFVPILVGFVHWRYRITSATVDSSEQRMWQVFDEVAAMLQDGRPYLCGDRCTIADVCFAAFSSPMLLPPEYGGPIATIEEIEPSSLRLVERFRGHPAGGFALRLYREERGRVVRREP